MFRFKHISHKFMIPTMLILTIIFILISAYMINQETEERFNLLEENIEQNMELMSSSLVEPLYNYDYTTAENIAEAFFVNQAITKLEILDEFDEEVVKYEREAQGSISSSEIEIKRNGDLIGEIKVEFDSYYVTKEINDMRNNLIFSGFIILIILAIAIYLISKTVVRPIILLKENVNQINDGNLAVDDLREKEKDEVGDLIKGFNQMKNKLKNEIGFIKTEIDDTACELLSCSQELSASAEEGNATIESTNNLIANMSEKVAEISTATQEVANFSQKARTQSIQGDDNIEATVNSIKEINQEVNKTVTVINALDKTSEEIEEIVELINNIADQTNLLALNASIEAARAGEHGQGFAVVAEEIRQLAGETSEATEKIATLVDKTQKQTSKGIKRVKTVEKKAEKGHEIAKETGKLFNEVKDSIEGTSMQIEETANATNDLAQNSDEVKDATEDINEMSDELTDSSQDLTEIAQNLKELIDKFNV